MRKFLLTTTFLTLAVAAQAQTIITPGSGTITDASGNTWQITADGAILEDSTNWVPGGGGTAALTIVNGTVYGLDATGKGWFGLSGNGQYWASSPAPPNVTAAVTTTAAPATVASATVAATPPTTAPTASVATTTACAATANGTASGGFSVANGQVYAPNGKPFVALGIDVIQGSEPSLATLQAGFPGINFIRYAILTYPSPDALSGYVNQLTGAGIVVELEDHTNSTGANAGGAQGVVFSGAELATELNWYSAVASAFKSNPYVWFGTDNEPSTSPSVAALDNWQLQTYNAVRSTGNNSPILLEIWGYPGAWNGGIVVSDYSGMTNTVWDDHFYGWVAGYSTDQPTVNAALASMISATQASATSANGTMPVLIGEYGNSTTGMGLDPNASQVLTAVQSSGYGSAAWGWETGIGDALTSGGNSLSTPYGQGIAGYIQMAASAAPSVWATCPSAAASASVSVAQASDPATTSTPPAATTAPASTVPTDPNAATEASQLQQAETLLQQAQSTANQAAALAADPGADAAVASANAQLQAAIAAMQAGTAP